MASSDRSDRDVQREIPEFAHRGRERLSTSLGPRTRCSPHTPNSNARYWSAVNGRVPHGTFTVRSEGGARFYTANGIVGAQLPAAATAWDALSDSNSKTDFEPIKPREILSKVAALPVKAWHYKHDRKRLYIGPMAQDFHVAFGLGSSDKTISTLDSDGVMYAAIQGLVEELKDRDAKIGELEASGAGLKTKMEAMEERLNSLPPAR